MSRKRRERKRERDGAIPVSSKPAVSSPAPSNWLGEHTRYLTLAAMALIAFCTILIYAQTLRVQPINYEDPYYLVHSPYVAVPAPFSRLAAVWTEPYFANFHPVTTTTWLIDRAMAGATEPFDGRPFRAMQLVYAAIGASLVIWLYLRLGIPRILAVLGALVFAVHPIHTEVIAWLSARKDLTLLIFILLSVLSWLWARESTSRGEWRIRHALTAGLVLLAVLAKPTAVILPALFLAYEFCSQSRDGILGRGSSGGKIHPVLTRTLVLLGIFLVVGGGSALVFGRLLASDSMHGGWLIIVPIVLLLPMLTMPPAEQQLAAFRGGGAAGVRVLGVPFVVLSVVFGAGSAWTVWAQQQVGAIKGGLTLLPTLNLTFDVMLAYAGKAFVPAHMSASYFWSEYPYVSVKGLLGALVVCAALSIAIRLAGSTDRTRRLMAFGILWFLIALAPVSNLVPTSTKMADRYLLVPTVGSILVMLAIGCELGSRSRRRQMVFCSGLLLIAAGFSVWSYNRTRVWCGTTTPWNGQPKPDLSLWTAAVETDSDNIFALTNLGRAYISLTPPEAGKALGYLNRALVLGQASQSKIADHKQLDLTQVYETLGDGYLIQASSLVPDTGDTRVQKKEAYRNAVNSLRKASLSPSGFSSADARVLARLAEACEGLAQIDTEQLGGNQLEQREALVRERDQLRGESEQSMRQARQILAAGGVTSVDPNYRAVMIGQGNIIFGRETGATNDERVNYYQEALRRYQEAARLLPDDPRPLLYEGLCYERLTGLAGSSDEKRRTLALGEDVLRKALMLNWESPDYSPALSYRALAALYAHVSDYQSALESLRNAQRIDPAAAAASHIDQEIHAVEQFLKTNQPIR